MGRAANQVKLGGEGLDQRRDVEKNTWGTVCSWYPFEEAFRQDDGMTDVKSTGLEVLQELLHLPKM